MYRGGYNCRLDVYHGGDIRQMNSYQFRYEYDPDNFYGCDIDIKDFHIMEHDPRRRIQRNKEVYPIIFMNKRYRWEEAGQCSYHAVSARRYEYAESKYVPIVDLRLSFIEIFTSLNGILNVDNHQKKREVNLYSDRIKELPNEENTQHPCELPPLRLKFLSRNRFPCNVYTSSSLIVDTPLNDVANYKPCLILIKRDTDKTVPYKDSLLDDPLINQRFDPLHTIHEQRRKIGEGIPSSYKYYRKPKFCK